MAKVVIAGGNGFIGTHLSAFLLRLDHEVVVLTRGSESPPGTRAVPWDGETAGEWASELEGAAAVVNLAGSTIARKWTDDVRIDILQSRLRSTKAISEAIKACSDKPKRWINASAVGYYGDRGAAELDESSGPGPRGNFLVDTCVAWEEAARSADVGTTRKTVIRFGMVLGTEDGVLPPMVKAVRWFLGGPMGTGRQYMSWIHIKDLCRLIDYAIEHETPEIVNATAPHPATNRFFMAVLRGVLGRPWAPPVPAFLLRLAMLFGAPETSLVLEGQKVNPKAALDAGFVFEYDDLRDAVRSLVAEVP